MSRSGSRRGRQPWAWAVIIALGAITAVLGFVGWGAYYGGREPHLTWLYDTIELFTGGSGGSVSGSLPPPLEAARFFAPLVVASTVIIAGYAVFRAQIQTGRARLSRNHVVVCGAGDRGMRLARAFRQAGRAVTLIEKDETQPSVAEAREMGIPVVVGDASSPTQLRRANVARAGEVVCVVGGDDTSVEVATALGDVMRGTRSLSSGYGGTVRTFVGIDDPDLCRRLQARTFGDDAALRIEFFNLAISAAEDLLDRALDLPAPGEVPRAPCLAIAGLTPLGMAIAVQAVRRWQAMRPAGSTDRLTLVLVDTQVDTRADSISMWIPGLETVCDLRKACVAVDTHEFNTCDFVQEAAPKTIFVCYADESTAVQAALVLGEQAPCESEVVVCTRTDRGLARLFTETPVQPATADPSESATSVYPTLDRVCTPEQVCVDMRERLARILHLGYVFYVASTEGVRPGDPSMRVWDDLDEPIRESNRAAVDALTHVLAGSFELAVLTSAADDSEPFTDDEKERLAAAEHERYRRFKLDEIATSPDGRDGKGRTATDLVSWSDVSDADRRKQYDQIDRIPRMLAYAGFRLRRRAGPTDGNGGRSASGSRPGAAEVEALN
ncbi:MAG: NAD-binding protein [Acidimicrobiia bacterium]|nr:NAD-binding protein [Acidimicrobiia bacterium]